MAERVFDELRQYNDRFSPVNYERVTFFVEEEGSFIGGVEGYKAWNIFEISNIVVLDKGKGIGTQLMQKVEAYAKENGLTKLVAYTLDFQAPAFYKKLGFKTVAIVPNYAGEYSCHYLVKDL